MKTVTMVTIFHTQMLFLAFAFRDISLKCIKASSCKTYIKLKAKNQQLFFGFRLKMKLITPFRRFTMNTMAPTAMLPVVLLTTCRSRYEKGKKYSLQQEPTKCVKCAIRKCGTRKAKLLKYKTD